MLAPPNHGRRRLRSLQIVLTLLALATVALGAKPDDEAKKISREAMEEDYLATNMTQAVAKLQNALKVCQKGCSKKTEAELYADLGTVYSAGLSAHEDAVVAFRKMLAADPSATPRSAYITTEVQEDFDRAKKELGGGTGGSTGAGGSAPTAGVSVLTETPWSEQAVYHPIPVYVEPPAGVTLSRVVLRYRAAGQKEWKELALNKVENGFGGYIPCSAVQTAGWVSYFVTGFDTNLDRVASAGSGEDPRRVKLKPSISGRQPTLPNGVPPEACPRPEESMSCETDSDCPGSRVCRDLACVDEMDATKPERELAGKRKLNWISVAFIPDLTVVSSANDACSVDAQRDGTLSCFYSNRLQYDGTPAENNGNTLHGGTALGSMRAIIGFDRVFAQRITVGVRAGFAFLGTPERADGTKFLPFHGELRGAYFFSKDPFVSKGVRPYVLANVGVGQTSARLSTEVEDVSFGNTKLDVFRTSGPFFGGGGIGIQYAVSPEAALVLEVMGRAMFPDFAPVIAPSVGFTYGI